MPASRLKEMYFSQSSLSAYQSCQLKFRRRYLEGLYWPGSWGLDQQGREQLEQGRVFHLLAQRYFASGMDPVQGIEVGEPVTRWVNELMQLLPVCKDNMYLPEQELRLCSGSLRLLAKYDLLLFTPQGRALIYDWKTTTGLPKREYYARHLQTVIYRYLLCSAGEACSPYGTVNPEQVSMLYWNPRHPGWLEPLPYSAQQFAKDGQLLEGLIADITARNFDSFLATADLQRCKQCEYSPICLGERASQAELDEMDLDLELDWEEIDSVAIL